MPSLRRMHSCENKDIDIPCHGLWSLTLLSGMGHEKGPWEWNFGLGGQRVRNVQDCEMEFNGIYEKRVAYGEHLLKT